MTRLLIAGLILAAPVGALAAPRLADPTMPAKATQTAVKAGDAPIRGKTPRGCDQAPKGVWTQREVKCAIARSFPVSARRDALCIAWHESRLRRTAIGSAGERGLFQLHPIHRHWIGSARWSRMFDPVVNAAMARALWKSSGYSWRPWTTSRSCRA